jgi:hypothetical protein
VLVGAGKTGGDQEVASSLGSDVRLDGTLIYRDDVTMIEIVPDSAAARADGEGPAPPPTIESLGSQTLSGEIVDMKCYLGVMKPGRGKPHRACATNCIRGGIPPVLVVQDGRGASRHFLLVDRSERPVNVRVLEFVAEPIQITGEVVRKDNLYYLKADPSTYQRLAEG